MELTDLLAIGATFGGFELIKQTYRWLTNRKNDKKINNAEAETAEFQVIKDVNLFLQEQLRDKEQRFASQTDRLRATQDDRDRIKARSVELELQLKDAEFHRCNVKGCIQREPPNEYL